MRQLFYKIMLFTTGIGASLASLAQDINRTLPEGYDPHENKLIPDKVFEIGIPLLIIFLLINGVVSIFRINAERRLKEKALDKQISEATLVALFAEDRSMAKYAYIKWVLILAASGISLVVIYFFAQFTGIRSGYLALGIIMLFLSAALWIYYNIIRNK